MSQIKQLPPLSEKITLTRDQLSVLAPELLPYVSPYETKITQWTITPRRATGDGFARISIVVPANRRSGALQIQNMGRVGAEPAPDQDDLRPLRLYAFGTGKQGVNLIVKNAQSNTLQIEEDF